MEFLVTMTTHVPSGTSEGAVDEVRAREAARSRELAAEGHLLRLWRPPLAPGEWRTLGLFDAADPAALEDVLGSMPLRVWRTDAIQALMPHPNDPGRHAGRRGPSPALGPDAEFLTTFRLAVPPGTPSDRVDLVAAEEAARAHALARSGQLLRLWTLAGEGDALGLWRVRDSDELAAILASLPEAAWMNVASTPLSAHPNDPAS